MVSGCSAPSRNENALWAWSSTNPLIGARVVEPRVDPSVVDAVEEPRGVEQVVGETDDGVVVEGDVPFFAGPALGIPPVAGRAPGTGAADHARHLGERAENDGRTSGVVDVHDHATRGPEATEREHVVPGLVGSCPGL